MAVAKSRKSPSRRGMCCFFVVLCVLLFGTDPTSGEVHRRHIVTKDGYYRGREVSDDKTKVQDED